MSAYIDSWLIVFFCGFLAELHRNCNNAIDSYIASLTLDNVYYELSGADIIVNSNKVIGANGGETLEKILKIVDKKNSETDRFSKRKASDDQVGVFQGFGILFWK